MSQKPSTVAKKNKKKITYFAHQAKFTKEKDTAGTKEDGLEPGLSSRKKTLVRKPIKPVEVSSNWKTLLQTIKPPRSGSLPPHRKRKQPSSTSNDNERNSSTPNIVKEAASEVWFDNVDPLLLEDIPSSSSSVPLNLTEGSKE